MKYKWPDGKETAYSSSEVALYRTKGANSMLVVVDAGSLSGIPLDEFTVIQESVLDLEPGVRPRAEDWYEKGPGHGYRNLRGVITKVANNGPEDTIRAVWVNFMERPIVFVGHDSQAFNELDVGKILGMSGDAHVSVHRVADPTMSHDAVFLLNRAYDSDEKEYEEGLIAIRQDVVDRLLSGTLKDGVLGGYTVHRDTATIEYSDTAIVVCQERFGQALDYINRHCDSRKLDLYGMLKGLAAGPCKGTPVRVNGTAVTLDIRPSASGSQLVYINGRKIAQPDVDHVVSSVTCYPGAQDAYADFIDTVSKVSLKFHKAVANGLTWNLNHSYHSMTSTVEDDRDEDAPERDDVRTVNGKKLRVPDFMAAGMDGGYSCIVHIRKSAGKRSEANIMGRWRKIRDFDVLTRFLEDISSRNYIKGAKQREINFPSKDGNGYASVGEDVEKGTDGKYRAKKAPQLTNEDEGFIKLIARLDECLAEDDWILPAAAWSEGRNQWSRPCTMFVHNDETRAAVADAKRTLGEMFKASKDTRLERLVRSRLLLDEIIAETGARELRRGDEWVFEVTGVSGNTYVIDEKSASVHTAGGDHICIVRASNKFETAGYDYIASLIAVLRDDRYTARDVNTLQARVGRAA